MDIAIAHSLLDALRDDRCIFGYSGLFPDEHSARLIELGEAALKDHEASASVRGRLGYVMVEAYQNIVRHRVMPSGMSPWGPGRSFFFFRSGHDRQQVFTFNPVSRAQAKKLDRVLTELHGMDNASLKALFMKGIQRARVPGTRGAGLGLIEMVRRAGGRLGWDFSTVDAGHELFALTLELGGTEGMTEDVGELRQLSLEHKAYAFYAGHWSPVVEKTLLDLAEKERPLGEEEHLLRSALVLVVAREVGQAMDGTSPMLFALHGEGRTMLSLGGAMDRVKAVRLKERMSDAWFSFGAMPQGEQVLAMVHVPW